MAAEATTITTTEVTSPPKTAAPTETKAAGYEAFLEDMRYDNYLDDKAAVEKRDDAVKPEVEVAVPPVESITVEQEQPTQQSWASGVQSTITNFFTSKAAVVSKDVDGEGGVPALKASSSSGSGDSGKQAKETLSDWTERISQCHIDTACGKLEFEFKKEEEPPKGPAITEQGELLKIEGPSAPEPQTWTKQVSDATAETLNNVSTKAIGLMVSLGLKQKKEQMLLTDYYKIKTKPEKSLTEKAQELQSSVMSTIGLGEKKQEEKGPTQKLITDYDPNKSSKAAEEATEEEIPLILSVSTEPGTGGTTPFEQDVESKLPEDESKSSWWKKLLNKFQKSCPSGAPECSEVTTPKIEIPSFTLFKKKEEDVKKDAIVAEREDAEAAEPTEVALFGHTLCSCGPGAGPSMKDSYTKKGEEINVESLAAPPMTPMQRMGSYLPPVPW